MVMTCPTGACPNPRGGGRGSRPGRSAGSEVDPSLGLHPDPAVDPDRLAVEVAVRDRLEDHRGELLGGAEPLREQNAALEAGLERLAGLTFAVDGGVDEAGRHG